PRVAGAAVCVFLRGRERVLRPDAAVDTRPIDAAPIDAAIDAPEPDAEPVDAAADAARAKPHVDAATATIVPRATATLEIGAQPWGEITIDGKPSGQTPQQLVVPAGHHTIEIVFTGETPPRKQTFA